MRMGKRNSWNIEEKTIRPFKNNGRTAYTRPNSGPITLSKVVKSKALPLCIKEETSTSKTFLTRYRRLCQNYNLLPLTKIKEQLHLNILDVPADHIRIEEWKPLLEALQLDQELHTIVIRSNYQGHVVESASTEEKAARIRKCPVLFTSYCLNQLIASIVKSLLISNSLAHLELEGLPLSFKYLHCLLEGISHSKSLKCLSFTKIPIGDEGTRRICRVINPLPNVSALNLTACGLSSVGMGHIASLIKTQKIHRFVEIWQQSLRSQKPHLDSMWGLRHITLNCNPLLDDRSINILIDALDDDLWIKGVYMQGCGIGVGGATELMSFLQNDHTLAVIDIRYNKQVPLNLLQHMMILLAKKSMHNQSQNHQWIHLFSPSHATSMQSCFLRKTPHQLRNPQRSTNKKEFSSISLHARDTVNQRQCHQAISKEKRCKHKS